MLRTRYREKIFLEAAFRTGLPIVVDNTNPTVEERKKYIELARNHKFKIIGYNFEPDYDLSYERNEQRQGKEKVPVVGIKSTLKKLQEPSYGEGFDTLYSVRSQNQGFVIQEIPNKNKS